jgi:hypothetical protein
MGAHQGLVAPPVHSRGPRPTIPVARFWPHVRLGGRDARSGLQPRPGHLLPMLSLVRNYTQRQSYGCWNAPANAQDDEPTLVLGQMATVAWWPGRWRGSFIPATLRRCFRWYDLLPTPGDLQTGTLGKRALTRSMMSQRWLYVNDGCTRLRSCVFGSWGSATMNNIILVAHSGFMVRGDLEELWLNVQLHDGGALRILKSEFHRRYQRPRIGPYGPWWMSKGRGGRHQGCRSVGLCCAPRHGGL